MIDVLFLFLTVGLFIAAVYLTIAQPILKELRKHGTPEERLVASVLTTTDATDVELVVIRVPGMLSQEGSKRLRETWDKCMVGTALEGVQTVVVEHGITVDFVSARGGSEDVAVH